VIVAALQRQYDAAVAWASGTGEEAQGFSRGALRAMVEKGMINTRELRVIWRSEPIINDPTTVRADLPASCEEDMKLFHLALPRAHPEICHLAGGAAPEAQPHTARRGGPPRLSPPDLGRQAGPRRAPRRPAAHRRAFLPHPADAAVGGSVRRDRERGQLGLPVPPP
jgi:hypothetical protein